MDEWRLVDGEIIDNAPFQVLKEPEYLERTSSPTPSEYDLFNQWPYKLENGKCLASDDFVQLKNKKGIFQVVEFTNRFGVDDLTSARVKEYRVDGRTHLVRISDIRDIIVFELVKPRLVGQNR